MSFWLLGCCGEWEDWARKPVNHTSWVAVVTRTDRPKSARNFCVIDIFGVGIFDFVIGLSKIFPLPYCKNRHRKHHIGAINSNEFHYFFMGREKGRDLTQSCDKNPYTHRTIQKATWQHKNATKNFDYTTIADRLRTVSWSNSSHPTGVVKPVYERSTFPLTATAV